MPVVDHVTIVGGGVMGSGIGQTLLQSGYSVTIRDVDEGILEEAETRMVEGNYGLERAVSGGHLSEAEMEAALDRLTLTTDLDAALADAELVLEAVTEDYGIKGQVLRELDERTDDVPVFTNTSGYSVSALANMLSDPSRMVGAHFFNPVPVMDLVEIVTTPQSDEAVVELAESLADDLGKQRVTIDDDPRNSGFIVNRCWAAMAEEAKRIVRDGVATQEQVNLAMREGRGLPVGPLEGPGLGEEWD